MNTGEKKTADEIGVRRDTATRLYDTIGGAREIRLYLSLCTERNAFKNLRVF